MGAREGLLRSHKNWLPENFAKTNELVNSMGMKTFANTLIFMAIIML